MRPIPKKLKDEMDSDPYYHQCSRSSEGACGGRITWEHAFVYAGKQINERWAIIPLCVFHHLGEGLNKELNQYLALCRATISELAKYSRTNWWQQFMYLHGKFSGYPQRF